MSGYHYNYSTPKTGIESGIGGSVHSFSLSFMKQVTGVAGTPIKASDLGLHYFYFCPIVEGAMTIHPYNNASIDKVALSADFIKANLNNFIPVQVDQIEFAGNILIGL